MFEKTNVNILGIIENMSTFICSNCGHEEHIFGHGGAQEEAARQNVSFIGEIPLSASIRKDSDSGKRSSHPAYKEIAHRLSTGLKSAS
jgi:ATP-binding protein involved in chromosome partitioning